MLFYFTVAVILISVLGQNISPRIAYGDLANPGQFPYHVLFKIDDDYAYNWCGGALISKNYILTTAECLEIGNPRKAYLGLTNMSDTSDMIKISIDPDTDFIFPPNGGKLGLVKINEDFQFSNLIKPVALPDESLKSENLEGKLATLTGFGVPLTRHADTSKFLRYIEVPVIYKESCEKAFPEFFNENFLCASSAEGESFCFGDQGGPLVITNENGENIIIGVAFVQGFCGDYKTPGAYLKVTSNLDWIKKVINDS